MARVSRVLSVVFGWVVLRLAVHYIDVINTTIWITATEVDSNEIAPWRHAASQDESFRAVPRSSYEYVTGRGNYSHEFNIENHTRRAFFDRVDNYFDQVQRNESMFPIVSQLRSVQILREYIQSHSQEHLERLWIECGNQSACDAFNETKFVVEWYSCPLEAGNRIFRFMNGLLWAIFTDRIFLWQYFDKALCDHDRPETYNCDQSNLNSPQDCESILHLAEWVPSWEEWSLKLNLSYPVQACAIGEKPDPVAYHMDATWVPRVIRTGKQINMETALILSTPGRGLRRFITGPLRRMKAQIFLREQGVYFAYGMLFESLFTLDASLVPTEPPLDNSKVDTYLLHSRHQFDYEDGSAIHLDVSCMNKVLGKRTGSELKPCVVYVMTDRAITREKLPDALAAFNCTAVFTRTSQGQSFRNEHGPFAGRGYYQDLAMTRHARRGLMSPNLKGRPLRGIRTSTALPRSLVEFRRVLESSSPQSIPDFPECTTF
jgi:hypothetical protein